MKWHPSLLAIPALSLAASSHAATFDGSWSVVEVCDATGEGARGYTWRFDAIVKDGHLIGQYGTKGESPSMTLEGDIGPDGAASFFATGIAGDSAHNKKFAPPQSPIKYRVAGKFEAAFGTADRLDSRRCKFTFSRR